MAWRRAIVVFRRDLRLHDQRALAKALAGLSSATTSGSAPAAPSSSSASLGTPSGARGGTLYPIFVFDPRQCDPQRNTYFNGNSVRFMVESLTELEVALRPMLNQNGEQDFSLGEPAAPADASAAAPGPTAIPVDSTSDSAPSALTILCGEAAQVIESLLDPTSSMFVPDIDALVVNEDVTPFSRRRDADIADACQRHGVEFVSVRGDGLLLLPETIRTKTSNTVYKVFTPFYRACLEKPVSAPVVSWPPSAVTAAALGGKGAVPLVERLPIPVGTRTSQAAVLANAGSVYEQFAGSQASAPSYADVGGRSAGLTLLAQSRVLKDYAKLRDDVTKADDDPKQGTTRLGPHLKFGTIGIREEYAAVRSIEPLARQLYWREFYSHLAYNFPELLRGQVAASSGSDVEASGTTGSGPAVVQNANMQPQFDSIWWDSDEANFRRWCEGRTGFPLVDAGIRQLLATGQMHNRARMLTACFLTKDLHIDWRKGERFFAQHLTDYDPPNNNGGWQWAASTGADSQPYFRIFNPSRQLEKFDKEAKYVKRWVPELAKVPASDILKWDTTGHQSIPGRSCGYPAPMLDHATEAAKAISMFAAAATAAKASVSESAGAAAGADASQAAGSESSSRQGRTRPARKAEAKRSTKRARKL